jgi:hypothetical protein
MMVYYQRFICDECIGKLGVKEISCEVKDCPVKEKEIVIWLNNWTVPFKCKPHRESVKLKAN